MVEKSGAVVLLRFTVEKMNLLAVPTKEVILVKSVLHRGIVLLRFHLSLHAHNAMSQYFVHVNMHLRALYVLINSNEETLKCASE